MEQTTAIDTLIETFSFMQLETFVRQKCPGYKTVKTPTDQWDVPVDKLFAIHNQFGVITKLRKAKDDDSEVPLGLFAVEVKVGDELKSRSCRQKQYELAKNCLRWLDGNRTEYGFIRQGIFVFYAKKGNFRFSLVSSTSEGMGTKAKWSNFRRQTFFVEKGAANRTFRDRMLMPWNSLLAIKDAFSVEALNNEFYQQLSSWYFWAQDKVTFPEAAGKTEKERNATSLIRLITRIMFVWFMKQKYLIPEDLFECEEVESWFAKRDKTGSTYYKAILQNLFFATLNTEMGKGRKFVEDVREFQGKNDGHGIQYFYRYKRFFKNPEAFLKLMSDVPFLNGGLFSSLDEIGYDEKGKIKSEKRVDCFSTTAKNESLLAIPDELFWVGSAGKKVDLSKAYGDSKRNKEEVPGLIPLLQRYNFTVDESSKNDETVALDPELLGRVFENLLASYNPETKENARKKTGSFYTPREIVNYMVEESLIQNLKTTLKENDEAAEGHLRNLVVNAEADATWVPAHKTAIIAALQGCKILDPACGSGAFPMGILQAMLRVWGALDPVGSDTDIYERKLRLIEECIYGVDIQPIAVQISKLRCFISLLAEDNEDKDASNRGIEPLPNLEMHFVTANSLIGVDLPKDWTRDEKIVRLEAELREVRHTLFKARTATVKRKACLADKNIREKLKQRLIEVATQPDEKAISFYRARIESSRAERMRYSGEVWVEQHAPKQDLLFGDAEPVQQGLFRVDVNKSKRDEIDSQIQVAERAIKIETDKVKNSSFETEAEKLALWDPFDQNTACPFFDMEWMFGITDGFNIVIGNPPYVRPHKIDPIFKQYLWKHLKTFIAKADLYSCFMEKGLDFLARGGLFTYIVPHTWTSLESFVEIRKLLATKTQVLRLVQLPKKVFADATVETCIFVAEKNDAPSVEHDIQVDRLAEHGVCTFVRRFRQADIPREHLYNFQLYSHDSTSSLSEKMTSQAIEMATLVDFVYGFKTADDDRFIFAAPKHKDCKPFIRSAAIHRYHYEAPTEFVWYVPEKMIANRKTARPGEKKRFESEKIIVSRMGKQLVASYDIGGLYVKDAMLLLKKPNVDVDLHYLLGLLNSKLLGYYYSEYFITIDVLKNALLALPVIPVAKPDSLQGARQVQIILLVQKILVQKANNPSADTSTLEQDVDELVYKLYGLDDEEVRIVKESLRKPEKVSRKDRNTNVVDAIAITPEIEELQDDSCD